MTLSGHKTRSVFGRYNIVTEGDSREAGRKLDAANRYETVTIGPKGRAAGGRRKQIVLPETKVTLHIPET